MKSGLATIALSLFAFVNVAEAEEKKDVVKGSLVMGETTITFANVIAYETKRSDKKRTVVIFSEKPLKIDKLKESFKSKGDDSDFFAFESHLKLIFDEKGELLQMVIYSEGKNINLSGDDNIKATANFANGSAKGKSFSRSISPLCGSNSRRS